jgi:hypothetical protein
MVYPLWCLVMPITFAAPRFCRLARIISGRHNFGGPLLIGHDDRHVLLRVLYAGAVS